MGITTSRGASAESAQADAERAQALLRTATAELAEVRHFDYVVFNEDGKLEDAVEQICNIVSIEHRKVHQPDIRIP